MKNLKYTITMVALFAFLFSNKSLAQSISPKEIAQAHNYILEKVLNDNGKANTNNLDLLETQIFNVQVFKLDRSEKIKIKNLLDEKVLNRFKKEKKIDVLIDFISKSKDISSDFKKIILRIYDAINKKDKNLLDESLNALKNKKFKNRNDNFLKNAFVETWNASNDYWSNHKQTKSWSWQNTLVLFSDAAGTVVGVAVGGGTSGGLLAVAGGAFGAAYASAFVGSILP